MNWIDYLIIGFSCFLMLMGFRRGLIRELLSIAAIISGFLVALASYETCATFLEQRVDMPLPILNVISFAVLFLITSGLLLFIGYLWRILTASTPVAIIDGLLGAAFGFLKAVFIVSIVLMLMVNIGISAVQDLLNESYIAPHFLTLAPGFYQGLEEIIPVDISGFKILK